EQRLAFCRERMGIEHTVRADGTELKRIEDLTGGNWADVVIDATGSNKSMVNAMNYVAFAGKLVFVGITNQEIAFTQPLMHRREMSFLASRNALTAEFTQIIRQIEDGMIDTKPWITHHAGFDEMIELFPKWMKPETGVIKAVVEID
ncbi:MAG: zinc-binding dehydrogenase, partial [Planctomycetia bacterium]|nr:zinc-binding dehydrogenase [Planctomycetia bacterium]